MRSTSKDLEEELAGMTLSQLNQRAKDAGIDNAAIGAFNDESDAIAAILAARTEAPAG